MTDAIFLKFPLNSLKSILLLLSPFGISQLRNQKFEQILIFQNRIFIANIFQQDVTSTTIHLLTTKSFISKFFSVSS